MKNNFEKITDKIKIALFIGVMAVLFFIGLLFFLRPTVSDAEKRELTRFPAFTVESFLSGEWTSQVSLWFADTYPMREGMIEANNSLEELYGVRDEQVIADLMAGFEIDQVQAEYISNIRLRNLNKNYILNNVREAQSLRDDIADMEATLADELRLRAKIAEQLATIKKNCNDIIVIFYTREKHYCHFPQS